MPVPKNIDAFKIYMMAKNQMIIGGMGTVVGHDYNAVKMLMDLYGIDNQRDCFERVLIMLNRQIELISEDAG